MEKTVMLMNETKMTGESICHDQVDGSWCQVIDSVKHGGTILDP